MGVFLVKNKFPGYYNLSDKDLELLWSNCLFIFDTNVLLDFYRVPQGTRDTLFRILGLIKDRIWIPHQVALEYHTKVIEEIATQESTYDEIKQSLNKKKSDIEKDLNQFSRHVHIEVKSILTELDQTFRNLFTKLDDQKKEHPNLLDVQHKISLLFENKVGEEYTEQQLQEKYHTGKIRYENNVPPGFDDKKKESKRYYNGNIYEDKYGDLIVWHQILDKAKTEQKSVIFITGDNKSDWWQKSKGKTIGPHPYLIQEFKNIVGSKAMFYMYQTELFIRRSNEYLKFDESNQSVDRAIQDISTVKETRVQYIQPIGRVLRDTDQSGNFKNKFELLVLYLQQSIGGEILIALTEEDVGRDEKKYTLSGFEIISEYESIMLILERKGDEYKISFNDLYEINFQLLPTSIKFWLYTKNNTWRFYLLESD